MSIPPAMTIRYAIDVQDRLIEVDEHWTTFAQDNDGAAVAPDRVLGRKLWTAIADLTLRTLYRQMVHLARQGDPVRFSFRCDSPDERRLFDMEIRQRDGGVVEFTSTLRERESRPAVPLLDSHRPRSQELVRMCSWCQRVSAHGRWLPVEAAVEELGLMHQPALPGLTHGMCSECYTKAWAVVQDR